MQVVLIPGAPAWQHGVMGRSFRLHSVFFAFALTCALIGACARPIEIQYFFSPVCPACEESQKALEQASSLSYLQRQNRRIHLETFDVVHSDEASDALFAAIDKYRVALDRQTLPLLIVDGTVYSGLEEVESAIRDLASGTLRRGAPRAR